MKTRTVKSLKEKIKAKSIQEKANELNAEVQKEQEERRKRYLAKFNALSEEEGCTMAVSMTIVSGADKPEFKLIPVIVK